MIAVNISDKYFWLVAIIKENKQIYVLFIRNVIKEIAITKTKSSYRLLQLWLKNLFGLWLSSVERMKVNPLVNHILQYVNQKCIIVLISKNVLT